MPLYDKRPPWTPKPLKGDIRRNQRPRDKSADTTAWQRVRVAAAEAADRGMLEADGLVTPRQLYENALASLRANPVSEASQFDETTVRLTLWAASRGLPPKGIADMAGITVARLQSWQRKGGQGREPYRCWSVAFRILLTGRLMAVLPSAIEKDPWKYLSVAGGDGWREPKEEKAAAQVPINAYQHNTYNLMMLPEGERMAALAAVKERVRSG